MMQLLLPLFFLSGAVRAEGLYLQLVRDGEPNAGAVAEAKEQLKQHKVVELVADIAIPPFHQRVVERESEKLPLCRSCHQRLPHAKSERSRTFLNMHSRFIACESCHLQPGGIEYEYNWVAYSQPGMEQVIDASASVHTLADKKIDSIVPRPGARIAPFFEGKPAYIFSDDPFADEIEQIWEGGGLEERARLKSRLHQPLEGEGRPCKSCHTDNEGILDLPHLGANERQQRAITHNVISRFFERYKRDDERLRLTDLLR